VAFVLVTTLSNAPSAGKPLGKTAQWGITIDPADSASQQIAANTTLVGRGADVVNSFFAWDLRPAVQTRLLDNLRSVNLSHEVMVTWEPAGNVNAQATMNGRNGLAEIASGSADSIIDAFLIQLQSFPGKIDLRFAHEMNGSWYPWAGDPSLYKRAWDHLHDRIARVAPRVKMVWSVNSVDRPTSNTIERYWPGHDKVDIIGIDGYNCLAGWQTPDQVFSRVYDRVTALDASVPIWITETASCEASSSLAGREGESKARWIADLLSNTAMPRVSAIVWFDRDKEYDWRTNSSAAATAALKAGLTR
jgi:mannan endo-1,4-beta-mannosidase